MSSIRKDQQRPQTDAGDASLSGDVVPPVSGEVSVSK